jgi:Zn-dependent alcohol dehydrogenase
MATQGGGFRPSADIPRYINLWRSGRLNLDGIISHTIPLSEINQGIDLVRAGQAGRILVKMR